MPEHISEQEKEIIIARLETVSPDLRFAEGGNENAYTRDDMIQLIRGNTPAGIEFVRTEWEFMRTSKDGSLTKALTPNVQSIVDN